MPRTDIFSPMRSRRDRLAVSALAIAATAFGAASVAPHSAAADDQPVQLGPVRVQGEGANAQKNSTGLGRLPGSVQDTPQTLTVVPQQILRQRAAATIDDALRNVAGITMGVGEGGGSFNGDQFRIRGFDAKDDIYVDGLRDFGVYTRDAFNTDQVQVLKGPSSEVFGRGTTGGGINILSKTPNLKESASATLAGGTGAYYRGTADLNMPVGPTAAIRLNMMLHSQHVVDRDLTNSKRWGIAPSFGIGLGTDTTFNLIWLHQRDERIPDYGVPVLTPPGQHIGLPVTENAGVDRSTFYGFDRDYDDSTVDMITGKFEHHASDWLTFYNDTRIETQKREYVATRVSCDATCLTALYDTNPATTAFFVPGGAASATGPYDMKAFGVQNIGTAVADGKLGGIRHRFVTGFDVSYQSSDRNLYTFTTTRPTRNALFPNNSAVYGIGPASARNEAEGTSYAFFASDQIYLTPKLSVIGGVRWEHYDIEFDQITMATGIRVPFETSSSMVNPRASVVYEPTENQTYYFSWVKSATPQGTSVTNLPTPVSATLSAGGIATRDLDPEESTLYELGAKFGLFDGRLGLSTALFRVEKSNTKETDGLGTIISSGDKQRIQGVEFSANGEIVEGVVVTANYAYLDSKTLDSVTGTPPVLNIAAIGKPIANAPKHAASFWTTYQPVEHLSVGVGANYRSKIWLNNTNTTQAPYTLSVDAMVAYELRHVRFAVNATNLTNRVNYSGTTGGRVVPAPGRAFIFSTSLAF